MAVENPWVGYLDRSYQNIKASLVSRLVTSNPEVTDHSESNILITIIGMFAGLMEMLGYYIDNMAREAFVSTARKFTSMVKLVKLLDYRIKAAYPATVDLLFTFNAPATALGIIPINTVVKTNNGLNFRTVENVSIAIGDINATVGAKQVEPVVGENLGTTTGVANEAFSLGQFYVQDSSVITIDSVVWDEVTTLGFSTPLDKHYVIEVDVDGLAYVVFGNGTNGMIPPSPKVVFADFDVTDADLGNVNPDTITTIVSALSITGVTTITVTNPLAASGGSLYEGLEEIRVNAPLSIRTLDRAVTRQDYIDIARMAPGVGRAEVYFECGKTVDIYIAPNGGGIAQSPLLFTTTNWINLRKMLTTFINVTPAGETEILITLDVTAKFRAGATPTYTDVINALLDYGSYDKQNINKKVRVSDIIALVDDLSKVENVDLVRLATAPYARPTGHTNQLYWNRESLVGSTVKSKWKITYTGANFIVVKDTVQIGIATISTLFTDPAGAFSFTILPFAYNVGDIWTFTVYPYNKNIDLDDFTIPKTNILNLIVNVTEQLIPPIE